VAAETLAVTVRYQDLTTQVQVARGVVIDPVWRAVCQAWKVVLPSDSPLMSGEVDVKVNGREVRWSRKLTAPVHVVFEDAEYE